MAFTGLVDGNKQNAAGGSSPRTRSKFPQSYVVYDTHRFGEYHPHFVWESVPDDREAHLRSSHDVRSYTLKAPLMQDISLKKDYFMVPMEAILPRNWEKWYRDPAIGGDVADNVGTGVGSYWQLIGSRFNAMWSSINTQLGSLTWSSTQFCTAFFRFLIFGEQLYSDGNLFSSLGFHCSVRCKVVHSVNGSQSYDQFFDDMIITFVHAGVKKFDLTLADGSVYSVILDGTPLVDTVTYPQIAIHDALELMRDNPFGISNATGVTLANLVTSIKTEWDKYTSLTADTPSNVPQNLKRLWAYGLICSHYYTNDHIDYVYSAELYRQYIDYLIREVYDRKNASIPTFTLNGMRYYYDAMSAYYFEYLFSGSVFDITTYLIGAVGTASIYQPLSAYISALFGYKRSLRFTDYFTGSRTRPLAVGDVNIDVQTGTPNFVSAIDVTKNIQKQRFLNAVNRARNDIKGYVKELFGVDQAPDYHNPFYLGHTSDIIFGSEVENTGAAQLTLQNSVTSVLRSNGSRFSFTFGSDRDCIVLGLSWYDISRAYGRTFERQAFQMNRYDMFNPFMQFIGDQPIYQAELNLNPATASGLSAFSYTNRHMEFKQRYNQAFGGFLKFLPSWVFLSDQHRRYNRTNVITPDYIRSFNSELDDFYVSLTGYSLGSYFHFIVKTTNDMSASRPMAYAPSIL